MNRSQIDQPPCYFDKYIGCVVDDDIWKAFERSHADLDALPEAKLKAIGDKVYEEGKWTVAQILQHIVDSERVLAYRALRIARNDQTELPGFDQDLFANNVGVLPPLEELIDDLHLVRRLTERLFKTFDGSAAQRSLTISGNQMSSLAYGFAIIGHQRYHLNIIETKYYPLVSV